MRKLQAVCTVREIVTDINTSLSPIISLAPHWRYLDHGVYDCHLGSARMNFGCSLTSGDSSHCNSSIVSIFPKTENVLFKNRN